MSDAERMRKRVMVVLTLPTLGFSSALTLVTVYLPVILEDYTRSATLIGFAIGGEGIFASLIPLAVGAVSDRIWTRWGRRQPFMIFSAPFMAAALAIVPFQQSYLRVALFTFVFFAAYHFYTSPYQSLLPDVTPSGYHGRVQGLQSFMRGGGMFVGMFVAGLLFYRWRPSPFILCGLVVMIFTYVTVTTISEPAPAGGTRRSAGGVWAEIENIWASIKKAKGIHRFLVAFFLWESTLAGVRPFIMLYFTRNLGATEQTGALLLLLVGVVYMLASLLSGYAADRYGRARVMQAGIAVYLVGCVVGVFIRDIKWAFVLLPLFGLGGSIVLTLPYAILIRLMPKEHVGQFTGLFAMTRGMANIVAPVITGAAIDIAGNIVSGGTKYASIWAVAGIILAISIYFFQVSVKGRLATAGAG